MTTTRFSFLNNFTAGEEQALKEIITALDDLFSIPTTKWYFYVRLFTLLCFCSLAHYAICTALIYCVGSRFILILFCGLILIPVVVPKKYLFRPVNVVETIN
jgi:hypothetical protein